MDTWLQDVRYAARTLLKNPGFTAVTIACLALGIGVNSMMYSVVYAIVRPLPFADPDALVAIHEAQPANGIDFGDVSYQDFGDVKAGMTAFADVAAYTGRSLTFIDGGEPERLSGEAVTWNLFPMLGVAPALGRHFRADDDRPGAPGVVVLSDGLWRRRYSADPAVIGRTVVVNGTPAAIVGVMPPRFAFPENAAAWIPIAPIEHASPRTSRSLAAIGRLAPGRTIAHGRQELEATGAQLATRYPESKGWTLVARGIEEELVNTETRLVIFTMMGAVSLVLLIACSNVANLLLARASVRHREMAVRAALGAGRGRIVRQLLTESVMIALASTPPGIALAHVGIRLLDAAIPPEQALPYYIDWSIDRHVLLYTIAIAVGTGVVFGLAPALQATRIGLQDALKDRGTSAGGGRNRLRGALVVAEIALSLVLLVGASLFIRSFLNLQQASTGFDAAPLMTMRFYMPGDVYDDGAAMGRRVEDVVRRVETLPGVAAATASNLVPLGSGGDESGATPEGTSYPDGQTPNIGLYGVTPHFFRTLGVKPLAGRDFTDAEGVGRTGVAIVNETLAKRLWPKATDVIGQRFKLDADKMDATHPWLTVIGLVPDLKVGGVRERRPVPRAFVSYAYSPARNTGITIRVAGAPGAITQAARQQIRAADPNMPVFAEQTMEQVRALNFWQYGLFGWMFSIFGGIALLLAAIGVYGVLSYAVSQRTQEIGVRMALGASRRRVFTLIVTDGARLAGVGILCGIVGAAAVTRVVTSLLYNVSATDPVSFITTAGFLAVVAVVASYLPARRATSVDPMVALRAE